MRGRPADEGLRFQRRAVADRRVLVRGRMDDEPPVLHHGEPLASAAEALHRRVLEPRLERVEVREGPRHGVGAVARRGAAPRGSQY